MVTQDTTSTPVQQNRYRAVLRALRPMFLTVIAFSALISILMLTGSIYMLQVYDRVLSSGSISTLLGLFSIVVVLYVFLGLYDFLRNRMLSRMAARLDHDVGGSLFGTWLQSGVVDGTPDDTIRSPQHPMHNLETVRSFLSGGPVTSLFDLPFVPLFLAVLFMIHPWLGLATILGAGIVAVLALIGRWLTQENIRKTSQFSSVERNFTEKSRQNAEAITAMGMSDSVLHRWQSLHGRTLLSAQEGGNPSEVLSAVSRAFRMLLQSTILTIGALLVLRGEISAGMIIASSILSGRALAPVDQVIGQWPAIGRAIEAHRDLSAFFEDRPEEKRCFDLPEPTGQIVVDKVTKYAPGRTPSNKSRILTQVSFELAPGEGLGVIGNSAAGKSTLSRLLVGAWAPDGGEIRLDGATMDQWHPSQLGKSIGYLPQALEMLPGSIGENIARFDPAAKDTDIIAAARLAGVHDMILQLPDGYATQLGQEAETVPLSGGQLQRLGLARAIFGMPKIVVLDEPNSNLDVEGDNALTAAITALREAGSTVIVMAHRPSAIAAVNKILVLHSGMVAQFGDKHDILSGANRSVPDKKQGQVVTPLMQTTTGPKAPPSAQDLVETSDTEGRPSASDQRLFATQKRAAKDENTSLFRNIRSTVDKARD